MNITTMERQYRSALASSEYGDFLGDMVWVNCVWHNLGTSVRSVASSLIKKGLISNDGGQGEDSCVWLTDAGIALVVELDLPGRRSQI